MPEKEIKVFPYHYKLPNEFNTTISLKTRFDKENMGNNIKPYSGDYLLLIIDRSSENLLFGRFLKLRSDVPSVINRRTREEKDIVLDNDDNIKEESHFIWNVADKVIFGQYNYHAIRHFPHPLMYYLSQIFDSDSVDVRPIKNPDTFRLMERERVIKQLEVTMAQESLSTREKERGIPLIGALSGLSSKDESTITIVLSRGYKKQNELNKARMIEIARTLKEHETDLYSLRVVAENSKYDLLHDNLFKFSMKVNHVGGKISKANFYEKVHVLHTEKIGSIRPRLRAD